MRAWPVARSIFDAPYVREANEGTTSWIILETDMFLSHGLAIVGLQPTVIASRASPPLLEQSSSKNRGRASPVKLARTLCRACRLTTYRHRFARAAPAPRAKRNSKNRGRASPVNVGLIGMQVL